MLAAICCFASLYLASPSLAEEVQQEILIQDSGNDTIVNVATYRSPGYVSVGEAVKFTPPRSSWTLDAVHILSWVPYEENDTMPEERMISMEIRDENLKLLYRFTDSHLPYFSNKGE